MALLNIIGAGLASLRTIIVATDHCRNVTPLS
jgi:hypothetical protein